jgi:hypothetical protein
MQSQASLFDDVPINHSRRLYIIGNGFDLHHRIPSSYSHFGAYVRATDARLADIAENFLPAPVGETLWSRLEENLAWLDIDQIVDQASNFLNSPGADDWSDGDNHAYQYEVEQIATALSSRLKASFHAWLRTLLIPSVGSWTGPYLRLYATARYLSFNYTSTLTRLYDVPEDRILHIHGRTTDPEDAVMLGHAREHEPRRRSEADADMDFRVLEGEDILDRYFAATFKPAEKILARHGAFFESLSDIEDIRVLGHALSEVDFLYLLRIREVAPSAPWRISYFGDPAPIAERAGALGLAEAQVTLAPLENICRD